MEVVAEILVFRTDLRDLGVDAVQLGGDSHYAGNCRTED